MALVEIGFAIYNGRRMGAPESGSLAFNGIVQFDHSICELFGRQ